MATKFRSSRTDFSRAAQRNRAYVALERRQYEGFWQSVRGGFSADPTHYASRTPQPEIIAAVHEIPLRPSANRPVQVLDIGCGNGRNIAALAAKGYDVSGVDISPTAIRLASRLFSEQRISATLRTASATTLPFPASSFDMCIDAGCLHHLRKSQWADYRRELLRVLKPGGCVVLYCFSDQSGFVPTVRSKNPNQRWYRKRNGHFSHFLSRDELQAFAGVDFAVVTLSEVKKLHSPLRFFLCTLKKN